MFSIKNRFTRKAVIDLIKPLLDGGRAPKKYVDGDSIWLTDGMTAMRFSSDDFIFRPELFADCDLSGIIRKINPDAYAEGALVSMRPTPGVLAVRYETDTGSWAYVDKRLVDQFVDCGAYLLKDERESPVSPLLMLDQYGKLAGLIMPLRIK